MVTWKSIPSRNVASHPVSDPSGSVTSDLAVNQLALTFSLLFCYLFRLPDHRPKAIKIRTRRLTFRQSRRGLHWILQPLRLRPFRRGYRRNRAHHSGQSCRTGCWLGSVKIPIWPVSSSRRVRPPRRNPAATGSSTITIRSSLPPHCSAGGSLPKASCPEGTGQCLFHTFDICFKIRFEMNRDWTNGITAV